MNRRMMINLSAEEYKALLAVAGPRRMQTRHLAELIVRRWLERRGLVTTPGAKPALHPGIQEMQHEQPRAQ